MPRLPLPPDELETRLRNLAQMERDEHPADPDLQDARAAIFDLLADEREREREATEASLGGPR